MSWRKDASGWNIFFTLVFAFIMAPTNLIFEGFIFQKYWTWFIQPTFNLVVPSIALCIGLIMSVRFVNKKLRERKATEEEQELEHHPAILYIANSIAIAIFWFMGWAIYCFTQ